jgi:hypothetical protein
VLEGALHVVGFLGWVLGGTCRHDGDCQTGSGCFGRNVSLRKTSTYIQSI